MKHVLHLVLSFAFPTLALRADTFTWQGDANDNFGNSSNWQQTPGNGDVPGKSDTIILPHNADRFGIDLGGSIREVRQIYFKSNGSTNGNGYNWQFQNNTIRVFCDGYSSDIFFERTNGDGTILVKGAIELTADSPGNAQFEGAPDGAFTLVLTEPLTLGSNIDNLSINGQDTGQDDTVRLDASSPGITCDFLVQNGTLFLNNADALPNSTVQLSSGSKLEFLDNAAVTLASTSSNLNIPAGKTLQVRAPDASLSNITGEGTFRIIEGNADLTGGTSSFAGTLGIGANTYLNGSFPNAILNLEAGKRLTLESNASFKGISGSGTLEITSHTVNIGSGGVVGTNFGGFFMGGGVINLNGPASIFTVQYDGTLPNAFTGTLNITASEFEPGRTTFQNATVNLLGSTLVDIASSGTTTFGSLNTDLDFVLDGSLSIGSKNEDMAIAADLSGNGAFTKTGTGKLTYNGTHSGTGKFTLAAGSLAGTSSHGGDFESSGTIELALTGDASDRIDADGALTIAGSTLAINASGTQTADAIILFSYGSLSGTFGSVTGVPNGYALDYAYNDGSGSNHIALVDAVGPVVSQITKVQDQPLPTFSITFDEAVAGFDAADLAAFVTGFTGTPQFTVTGGGTTYQVVVSGLAGNGEISLGFSNTAAFSDAPGNAFAGQGTPAIDIKTIVSRHYNNHTRVEDITIAEAEFLIVAAGCYSHDRGFTGSCTASFGGQSMQRILYGETEFRHSAIFILQNPPAGTHTLDVRFGNSTNNNFGSYALLAVNGIDVVNPVTQSGNATEFGAGIAFANAVNQGSLTVQVGVDNGGGSALTVNGQTNYPGKTQISSGAAAAYNRILQQTTEPLMLAFDDTGSAAVFRAVAVTDYSNVAPAAGLAYAPGTASPTNATTVAFDVSFSEPVTGLSASDFVVNFIGGTTGTPTLSGSGASYTLTVPNVTGNGTLTVSLPAGTVLDAGGAPNTAAAGPLPVIFDQTPPQMTLNQPRTTLTTADSVIFDVTFNEAVTNFGGAVLNATSGIAYTGIQTAGSGSAYTVTVLGLSGDGFFSLDFNLGGIRDIAGNLQNSKIVSGAVTLDNTPPVITLNGSPTVTLALHGTYTESGAQTTDAVDGSSAAIVGGDTVNGSVPGSYTITYSATDTAGNTATQITRTVIVLDARQTWSSGRGLTNGVNDGFFDDPNGDARTNIVHFALDTNPLGNGSDEGKTFLSTLPDGASENYLTYTIPVRKGTVFSGVPLTSAPIDGVIYTIHGSTNLADSDSPVVERTNATNTTGLPVLGDYDAAPGPDYEYRTFRLATSAATTQRGFIWIEIQAAP